MKKLLKWLGIALSVGILILLIFIGYIKFMLPDVGPAPDLKVTLSPERVARGKYLAHSVAVCIDCHSRRDWSQFAGPLQAGTEGGGGEIFNREMGFPGIFYSKNITPYALSKWTDGEVYRAIACGVNNKNEALFPVMPYHYYGKMDNEDLYAIIAYIRTLPSIKNEVPARQVDFPLNIILNTIPQKATPSPKPDPADSVAYGGYLVNVAGCIECHTPAEKGQIIAGKEFGGGRTFELPGGTLTSSNITPHETGLGYWSREQFIKAFKQYQDSAYTSPKLGPKDFNTLMPWKMYGTMTESDLASIYAYLKTLKPIDNVVRKFTPRD